MRPLKGIIVKRGRNGECSIRLLSKGVVKIKLEEGKVGQVVRIQWDYGNNKPAIVWKEGGDPTDLSMDWEPEVEEEEEVGWEME